MTYVERVAASQRLCILRCLEQAPGYSVNDSILTDVVNDFCPPIGRDKVRTELAWLSEQGLVTLRHVTDTLSVATATTRGVDVAQGRVTVPGVDRPGPRNA